MFGEVLEYLSVFLASALNLNYGLGVSMTYELSREELFALMSTGSISGVAVCLLLGARVQNWWTRSMGHRPEGAGHHPGMLMRVWQKYGLWGLAFFTFLIGPVPPVAISLISGLRKDMILLYLGAGKFLWSMVFAYLGYEHIAKMLAVLF